MTVLLNYCVMTFNDNYVFNREYCLMPFNDFPERILFNDISLHYRVANGRAVVPPCGRAGLRAAKCAAGGTADSRAGVPTSGPLVGCSERPGRRADERNDKHKYC